MYNFSVINWKSNLLLSTEKSESYPSSGVFWGWLEMERKLMSGFLKYNINYDCMPTKNDVSKHTQIDDQRNDLNVHSDTPNCKRIRYKTLWENLKASLSQTSYSYEIIKSGIITRKTISLVSEITFSQQKVSHRPGKILVLLLNLLSVWSFRNFTC